MRVYNQHKHRMPKAFSKKYTAIVLGLLSLKLTLIVSTMPMGGFFASTFQLSDVFTSVITSEKIVELTNHARTVDKVRPLKVSSKLEAAAQKKADDMLAQQYFSHTTPGGDTPWSFINAQKYYYLYAGENLAMQYDSAERVVESWIASAAHRDNLLSKRFTEIGVGTAHGVYQGAQTTMVVQMFGRPYVSPVQGMSLAKQGRAAAISNSEGGYTDDYGTANNSASPMDGLTLVTTIYFYAVLLLLAHITFRYFWLQHYKDRRLTFYTLGTFVVLISTITLF